jgi:hypothetical protein
VPEVAFTVRMYGTRATLRAAPSAQVQLSRTADPQVSASRYPPWSNRGPTQVPGNGYPQLRDVQLCPRAKAYQSRPWLSAGWGFFCPGRLHKKPMLADVRVCPGRLWRRAVTATEHVIRWSTAGAVVGVAAVAAVASYEHAYALVRTHGEAGWTGWLVPLTVDGLIYASSR